MNIYLIAILVYLMGMLSVGIYFARNSIETGEDFMVAGRRLPLFIVIGTLLATFVGSGTIVGGASFVYQYGPIATLFNLTGGFLAAMILFFIAGKIRTSEIYTIPELIENRFGIVARTIASLFILIAYVGITAYQLTGGAHILQITTGVSLENGAIIMTAVVIFLTMSGGLFSVAYTDALSAILIIAGLLLAIPFALSQVGGIDTLIAKMPANTKTWNGGLTIPQLLGYFLPLFLLALGDQNMYQRFSASKDARTATLSTLGFMIGIILVIGMVVILATFAIVLFPNIEPGQAIFKIATNAVPMAIGAIILCSAAAFLITTATSYLLSTSSNIVFDLFHRFRKKDREFSEKSMMWYTRIAVLLLGILAYILGQYFPTVLAIQIYSYTMYGATITPTIIATLFWKKATTAGVLSSMIIGGLATIFWEVILNKPFEWNSVLFALPLSILALIIISLFTQPATNNNQSLTTGE